MKKKRAKTGKALQSPLRLKAEGTGTELSGKRVLPLTTVRGTLSPLLRQLEKTKSTVGIAVHGKVRGYLVPASTYERLQAQASQSQRKGKARRSALRGSLTLIGDLEQGSRKASASLMDAIGRSASELQ